MGKNLLMNEWRVVDDRTTDMPSYNTFFNMWTVSLDVSIQRRHWQPLSVHLWAYCTHPAHDVNDVMWEGWPQHHNTGVYAPSSFQTVVRVLLRPTRIRSVQVLCFPLADLIHCFTPVLNLGNLFLREQTDSNNAHQMAINQLGNHTGKNKHTT